MRETAQETTAAIADALDRGEFADAVQRLDTAVRRWPANAKFQVLKGTLLEKSQGAAQAALHFAGVAENPNIAPLAAKRLTGLIRRGAVAPDVAIELARRVSNSFIEAPDKEHILNAIFERAAPEQHGELLEILGSSDIFQYEWRLAVRKTEHGDFDGALRILELARQDGRISVQSASLLSELYVLSQRLPEAIAMMAQLREEHPDQLEYHLRLMALFQKASDTPQTARVFEQAILRWPHSWMLLLRLNRLPLDRQLLETAFGIIAENAEDALAQDERFRLQFALLCLHVGRVEQARELLSRPFGKVSAAIAASVVKALNTRSPRRWMDGARLVDNRGAEVQVTRAVRPRATIVVPVGISLCSLPLAFIDSLFAEHNVNVVYLRDIGSSGFLRGVRALGPGEAETIAALKEMVATMGAPRTIVMGASAGGFSALRYGALMEADIAISFSAPTDLGSLFGSAKPSIANPEFFARILLDRQGDLPLDLAPLLSVPRRTKSILFYGADAAGDARQAERLQGFPGVTLRPVEGIGDSFVVNHMIGDGSFDRLIEESIEG